MGTKWEQGGNKNPKVGPEWEQSGSKVGTQSGNKNPKVRQEWEQSGNKNRKVDKNGKKAGKK